MHEIDEMLKLQLEGKHEQARKLSDKLENIGREKILDGNGKNTEDIWLRHSFNRGWFLSPSTRSFLSLFYCLLFHLIGNY